MQIHLLSIRLISALLLLLSCLSCNVEKSIRGLELTGMPLTNFTLNDQHGNPFILSGHPDQASLMFFGFTYCPDVCPMTLATWKKVETELGKQSRQVNFLYVTVDADRDTPEKLKAHLENFSSSFIGLTGAPDSLKKVYANFGVFREKVKIAENDEAYLINHTASMYLLDKEGRWRIKHSNDANSEDIAHDLKLLLKE